MVKGRQGGGVYPHLHADPPPADVEGGQGAGGFVQDGGEELLHPHRAAAAPDIAGDFVDVLDGDELHRLFVHRPGGGFQVELGSHGDDKDEMAAPPFGHQGFVDLLHRLPQLAGHRYAVDAVVGGVGLQLVGDTGFVQYPHGVGFGFHIR